MDENERKLLNSKRGKYSRNKGARIERELANLLKSWGDEAGRTAQRTGKKGDADIDSHALEQFHIECKGQEKLDIVKALKQAIGDSKKSGKIPCVIHKKLRTEFMLTMKLEDFYGIIRTRDERGPIGERAIPGGLCGTGSPPDDSEAV